MNGLDSFGRMAGLLGGILHGNTLTDVSSTELLSAGAVDTTITPETPDLSTAVIINSDEQSNTEKVTAQQLALF